MTSQIIIDSSLSSVLMRGSQFASLGYHYGKGSTALTLHRGGKASTYHVVVVDEVTLGVLGAAVGLVKLGRQPKLEVLTGGRLGDGSVDEETTR